MFLKTSAVHTRHQQNSNDKVASHADQYNLWFISKNLKLSKPMFIEYDSSGQQIFFDNIMNSKDELGKALRYALGKKIEPSGVLEDSISVLCMTQLDAFESNEKDHAILYMIQLCLKSEGFNDILPSIIDQDAYNKLCLDHTYLRVSESAEGPDLVSQVSNLVSFAKQWLKSSLGS